jgi:hypothetical protein
MFLLSGGGKPIRLIWEECDKLGDSWRRGFILTSRRDVESVLLGVGGGKTQKTELLG